MFFVAETLQKRARIPSGSNAQTRQRGYYPREKISGAVKTVPCRNQRTTICEILPIALLVLIRLLSFAKIPKFFRAKIYCIAIPPVNFPEAPPPGYGGRPEGKHLAQIAAKTRRHSNRTCAPERLQERTPRNIQPRPKTPWNARPERPSASGASKPSTRRSFHNCFAPAPPRELGEFQMLSPNL